MSSTQPESAALSRLRERCVAAGLAILDREGIERVDLRAVARHIGKSRTAPYLCFGKEREGGGRGALLAAIAARGFDDLAARLDSARQGDPGAGALRRAAEAWVAFARERPGLYRLMFGPETASRSHLEGLNAARWRAQGELRRALDGDRAAGQVRSGDSLQQAQIAWALLHGLATLTIDGDLELIHGRDRADQVVATALELFLTQV